MWNIITLCFELKEGNRLIEEWRCELQPTTLYDYLETISNNTIDAGYVILDMFYRNDACSASNSKRAYGRSRYINYDGTIGNARRFRNGT